MKLCKKGECKMMKRTLCLSAVLLVAAVAVSTTARAWGMGYELGETKDKLKLKYDVAVEEDASGRVTVVFTLADEGRLSPLDVGGVQLVVPSKEKNEDGSQWMERDLVVSIDMAKTDSGKRVGRVHLVKELAERAEIHLNTHTLDGKLVPLTRMHHAILIAKYLKKAPAAPPVIERK